MKSPFDDLQQLIDQLPPADAAAQDAVRRAAGDGEAVSVAQLLPWLAGWQGQERPGLTESHICVLASAYAGTDAAPVMTFIEAAGRGQTALSHLCRDRGVGLRVLEMAPTVPHQVSEDWSERDCMAAVAFGMEATAAGGDLLGLAALAPGGADACQDLCEKILSIIDKKQLSNTHSEGDALTISPLHLMRTMAGREVAASVGAMVAARSRRLPVLVEGWPGLAALAVLMALDPRAGDHVQIASVENEAQASVAAALGKHPIIGMPVTTGPGAGIALAISALVPLLSLLR